MNKRLGLLIVISLFLLNGCQKDETTTPFEERILSNWIVMNGDIPSVTEWGLFYVGSVKLYRDKSFRLNLGDQVDDYSATRQGTWELKDNKRKILFYTYVNDVETVYSDTTEFNISIDNSDKLILENEWIKILHKRQNN